MSSQPLDESYFVWLYSQVADPEITDPSLTYWKLLKQVFQTEFVWRILNDENRAKDGKDLRYEFIRSEGLVGVDPDWMNLGCSVLELMVGLSRRMAFLADGEPHYWFWKMMDNIGLRRYTDDHRIRKGQFEEVLERVVHRLYSPDGSGGFFPLKHPEQDQRGVELWYQMGSYILEQDD